MNSKDLYLRLLSYVRPYARIFALSLLGTVAAAATEPLIPALIKPLLDGSFVAKDPHSIRLMPLLLVAVFVIRGIAGFVGSVAMEWIATGWSWICATPCSAGCCPCRPAISTTIPLAVYCPA